MENLESVGFCRCCGNGLHKGLYKDLWNQYTVNSRKEIYGKIFKKCFHIDLPLLGLNRDWICKECVQSLLEADTFRQQVLEVQTQFQTLQENTEVTPKQGDKGMYHNVEYLEETVAEYLEIEFNDTEEDSLNVELIPNEEETNNFIKTENINTIEDVIKNEDIKPEDDSADLEDMDVEYLEEDEIDKEIKIVKRIVLPSRESLIQAVKAVKDNKMTTNAAKKFYNINGMSLKKIIDNNIDLETVDLSCLTDRRKNKNYSLDMLKLGTSLVQQKKLSSVKAAELFNLPLRAVQYRMKKGFREDHPEKLIDKRKINRKGVVINEVDNSIARDPIRFNRAQRLILEDNAKDILKLTNATPFLILGVKYICGYCNDVILLPDELRNHVENHTETRLKVEYLLRPAEVKEILRIDVLNLKCVICDLELKWADFYDHLTVHDVFIDENERKKIVPYNLADYNPLCVICNHQASTFKALEIHLAEHFNNHMCNECGRVFMVYHKLKTHEYQKRQRNTQIQCEMCECMITGKYNYEMHMAKVHKLPMCFPCKHCNERFKDAYMRHMHMVEKHREHVKEIVCDCGKVFLWKGFYTSHYRKVHLKQKNYECEVCKKRFFATDSYKKHCLTHLPKTPLKCDQCFMEFTNKSLLTFHLTNKCCKGL